jgi:hypothetical protein
VVNEQSLERAAYLAANLIEGREIKAMELSAGSPGTRRSIKLDEMARIIKEVMVKELEVQMSRKSLVEYDVVEFHTVPLGSRVLMNGHTYTKQGPRDLGTIPGHSSDFTRDIDLTRLTSATLVRLLS